MCPVVLDSLSIETLLLGFVIEDFGNNNFWRDILTVLVLDVRSAIGRVALGKPGRIGKASRVEERVRFVESQCRYLRS